MYHPVLSFLNLYCWPFFVYMPPISTSILVQEKWPSTSPVEIDCPPPGTKQPKAHRNGQRTLQDPPPRRPPHCTVIFVGDFPLNVVKSWGGGKKRGNDLLARERRLLWGRTDGSIPSDRVASKMIQVVLSETSHAIEIVRGPGWGNCRLAT